MKEIGRIATASIVGLALLFGAMSALRAQEEVPTISIDEIKAGQKGYGLTVFSGVEPERFEVEVLGVMRNVNPGSSFILVKLIGPEVEKTGVAAGMSGSPVYLDGRLAGAVAFGWPFAEDAVGGVTPIAAMRNLPLLPLTETSRGGRSAATTRGPILGLSEIAAASPPLDLLERKLRELAPRSSLDGSTPSIVWSASGLGPQSFDVFRRALGSVVPSGASSVGAEALIPGGAISAVLVDGDHHIAATGTVTDRSGDRVLAFGHPFLGFGPVRVPMAAAEVVTIFSSQYNSFKIANFGPIVGAIDQDRQSAIQGRLGASAPMFPLTIKVQGDRERIVRVRVASVPEVAGGMVGGTAISALESTTYSAGPQSIELAARFKIVGHPDLEIRQAFDGDIAAGQSVSHLLSIADYLFQNDLEPAEIEALDVEITQLGTARAATLEAARADRYQVEPGERIRIDLDFVARRGAPFRRTLELDLPDDLPLGRYSVLIGDGPSVDAARLQIEPRQARTIAQAIDQMRGYHSRRELVAIGVHAGAGLSVAGVPMPQLPSSIRSFFGTPNGAGSAAVGATPLRSVVTPLAIESLTEPIMGLVRVDLEIRKHRGEDGEGGEGGNGGVGQPGRDR